MSYRKKWVSGCRSGCFFFSLCILEHNRRDNHTENGIFDLPPLKRHTVRHGEWKISNPPPTNCCECHGECPYFVCVVYASLTHFYYFSDCYCFQLTFSQQTKTTLGSEIEISVCIWTTVINVNVHDQMTWQSKRKTK